jgi:DNA uptake protein ComE-like DNA-binding protein
MNKLKSHFRFSKQEQNGIFFLLMFIILLQLGYFYLKHSIDEEKSPLQLDVASQHELDSLKEKLTLKDTMPIYPFNPNYITDFKGYTLGLSVEELDRLFAFRASGNFVNSITEFQSITQVSDSVLKRISPFFKFPDWVVSRNQGEKLYPKQNQRISNTPVEKMDLNSATANELLVINGIGEVLSARIIKFRDRLGGFLVNEQLYDVYGLEKEVADRALDKFSILNVPNISKINVNEATVGELSKLIYLQGPVPQRIIDYRNVNGNIESFEDLIKIKDFPSEKIDRIKLYLTLKK